MTSYCTIKIEGRADDIERLVELLEEENHGCSLDVGMMYDDEEDYRNEEYYNNED